MKKALSCALLALLLATAPLSAQEEERPPARRGAAAATAEGRFAWDYRSETPGLGVALRLPLLDGRGDLVVGGDAIFRKGLAELQGHLDVVAALGGRSAVVVGGGPLLLSSVFSEEAGDREARWGYSLVAGLRQLPDPDATVGFTLELRWVFVDALEPRYLSLGVGVPLFRMPF